MKLVIENVGKQYRRDFWGLSNFSLELAPGIAHGLPDAVGEALAKIFGWM